MGAREFTRIVIDASQVHGARMFRLAERPTLLIVDEPTKEALVALGLRGARLEPLETSAG